MKLVAIFITYNPDIEETRRNCLACIDYVEKLIIWENTPEPNQHRFRVELPNQYASKVIYMGDGKNHCIAYPLNQAVRWAKENGYTHLLSMDQDSLFEQGHFACYRRDVERYSLDKSIGVFSANPNGNFVTPSDTPTIVPDTITSSSIYDLMVFEKTGGFREDFEIDAVDIEFSYRAARNGYSTVMLSWILLHQEYGTLHREKLGFYTDNYSPFRLYHIIRNYITVWKEYPQEFVHRRILLKEYILKRIVKVMLAEDCKIKKIEAIYLGLKDGLIGRLLPRDF